MRRLWPQPVALTGYGDGAFRFGPDMRHEGGLCILPDGIYDWPRTRLEELTVEDFAAGLAAPEAAFILFGAGERHIAPPDWLMRAAIAAGMGLEVMTTAAALRTYNVCFDERRPPATFLLPVR